MVENKVGVASKFGSLGLHTLRSSLLIITVSLICVGGISFDGIVSCCSSLPIYLCSSCSTFHMALRSINKPSDSTSVYGK